MKITKIDVKNFKEPKGNFKGVARVVIDDCFSVSGIKIIDTGEKRFVAMPSYKNKKNEFVDIACPINQETREYFTKEILKVFDNQVS